MKFLTSSSSSASSTITTTTAASFDTNVHNSRTTTPAGCIAGVFRRLLCLNSLPTHPSDHLKDIDGDSVSVDLDKRQCSISTTTSSKAEDHRVDDSSAETPSIVARLMGLESLPQMDFSATEKSPNSIARSRSMNSVDLMKELVSIQGRHRRSKSFRERAPPTFVELEDEEFFILSFENGDESRKLEGKSRKLEMCSGQMKQIIKEEDCKIKNSKRRESVYEKNKENQDTTRNLLNEKLEKAMISRKSSRRFSPDEKLKDLSNIIRPTNNSCQNLVEEKEVVKLAKHINHNPENELAGGRRRRIKKRKDDGLPVKKIETDQSDSQNSSPSSVLDILKFPCDPEVTNPEELSRLTNSKSRRTLTEELENYRKLNQYNDRSLMSNASCKSRSNEGQCAQLRKNNSYGRHNYVEMWGEICKMVEKDILVPKLSNEIQKVEDYKVISGEFEIQIFDELLGELVDQLAAN